MLRSLSLDGDCRVEQGGFSARGERMELWVDHYETSMESMDSNNPLDNSNKRWMYKAIIRADGAVEAKWLDDQRLHDNTWMGRLYSHRAPIIDVKQWDSETAEAKSIVTAIATAKIRAVFSSRNSNHYLSLEWVQTNRLFHNPKEYDRWSYQLRTQTSVAKEVCLIRQPIVHSVES